MSRFALRDGSLASTIIADFNKILKFKNIHESIICTLITSFSDLCKRHTSLVDSSIKTVILQLSSRYITVRSVALNNLNELILQDYVKMRGRVLLNILKLILDEDSQIAAQALYVIQLYVHTKNEKLLKVSLLECVYVFNNYLQYAESDMFPASEIDDEPCDLAGNEPGDFAKRNQIYDFFVENIDDLSLLKLLKNVNKINAQLTQRKYVECSAGAGTLLDLLYIFTKMVSVKDRDKARLAKAAASGANDEDAPPPPPEEGPSPSKKSRVKMALQQNEQEMVGCRVQLFAFSFFKPLVSPPFSDHHRGKDDRRVPRLRGPGTRVHRRGGTRAGAAGGAAIARVCDGHGAALPDAG